ncbi:MAG: hypothetical protein V1770_05265 [bacterium]
MREISPIPQIEIEKIDPQSRLSEEEKEIKNELRKKEIILRKDTPEEKSFERLAERIMKRFAGTCHGHSERSTRPETGHAEGIYTVKEMIEYYDKLGLQFGGFTEHILPSNPKYQNEDSPICRDLLEEAQEITELNKERKGAKAFSGVEADNMYDTENGKFKIDVPDTILAKMDIVIVSRHAMPSIEIEKNTDLTRESLLMAIKHPYTDIIGHPDRNTRFDKAQLEDWKKKNKKTDEDYWKKEYWPMWDEILMEMEKNNKAFEININSLHGREMWGKLAKSNVKLFINFDAHDFENKKAFLKDKIKKEISLSKEEKEKQELWNKGASAIRHWGEGSETEDDIDTIEEYEIDRLTSGPGSRAIRELVKVCNYSGSSSVPGT